MGGFGPKMSTHIVARDPCPEHGYAHFPAGKAQSDGTVLLDKFADCQGGIVGECWSDLSTLQFGKWMAQAILGGIAGAAVNILDVNNTNRSVSAGNSGGAIPPYIVAGTGATGPNFNDYNLQTFGGGATSNYNVATNYSAQALVGAISANNNLSITATITNSSGATITYKEVGLVMTSATFQFLICHDTVNAGAGFPVSATGTLTVTYTGALT